MFLLAVPLLIQTITTNLRGGYQIVAADLTGDGKKDLIALASGLDDLAALCFLVVGSALAFLWFNVNPASVFMGDAGALALGAGLATVALVAGQALLLIVVGFVFVIETASVIRRVGGSRCRTGKGPHGSKVGSHRGQLSRVVRGLGRGGGGADGRPVGSQRGSSYGGRRGC